MKNGLKFTATLVITFVLKSATSAQMLPNSTEIVLSLHRIFPALWTRKPAEWPRPIISQLLSGKSLWPIFIWPPLKHTEISIQWCVHLLNDCVIPGEPFWHGATGLRSLWEPRVPYQSPWPGSQHCFFLLLTKKHEAFKNPLTNKYFTSYAFLLLLAATLAMGLVHEPC